MTEKCVQIRKAIAIGIQPAMSRPVPTITLTLNCERKILNNDSAQEEEEQQQLKASSSKKFKVVLAEDEKPILGIFSSLLSRSGFRVTGACENGRDLVEFIEMTDVNPDLAPDIIVTDLRMPHMDGIEAAKRIRATNPEIKIVLASAYEVPLGEMELFDAILKKPFSKDALIETITRCLADE